MNTSHSGNQTLHNHEGLTTRRTLLAGLGGCIGLGSFSGSRMPTAVVNDHKGCFRLSDQRLDGCGPRAAAIAALFKSMGLDENFDYGTTRDACRMIMAADELIMAAYSAHEGWSIWENYDLEGGVIPIQELACLIAEQEEINRKPNGWTTRHIEQVLEAENRLVIEKYIQET